MPAVNDIFKIIVLIIQITMVPVGTYIAVMVTRAHRRTRLTEYKVIALVHAIQSDIAKNGFTQSYEKKLNELLNEYEFINKK
jgi:hypothetical protein